MLEKRAILRFQGYFEVTLGINGVQFLNSVKIKDKFRVLSLRRHQKISAFRPRKYLICARKTGEIVVDTLKTLRKIGARKRGRNGSIFPFIFVTHVDYCRS